MEKLNLNMKLGQTLGEAFEKRISATNESKSDIVRAALVQYLRVV